MIRGTEIGLDNDNLESKILESMSIYRINYEELQMVLEMQDGSVYSIEGEEDDIREYETYIRSQEEYVNVFVPCFKIYRIQ